MSNKKETKKLSRSAQRRRREKEYRYKTILNSASTLISQKGYNQASIEEIADLAEVSVGTVYFYFKNKEDLLINLIGELGYVLRGFLGNKFKKAKTPLAGFQNAGVAFFEEFCVSHLDMTAILFREAVGQGPEVEKARKILFDKITNDLKEALLAVNKKTKKTAKVDLSLEVMAVCIVGIYEKVAYHYLLCQNRADDMKTIGKNAVAFIMDGVNSLPD